MLCMSFIIEVEIVPDNFTNKRPEPLFRIKRSPQDLAKTK